MIFWVTLLALVVAVIGLVTSGRNYEWEGLYIVSFISTVVVATILLIMGLTIIINRMEFPAQVAQIEETVRVIELARQGEFGEIERATLQREILDINRRITSAKYWRQNKWTYLFHHPGVMNLEPIR